MILKNTKDCIALLIQLYGYPFSNWKRTRKYKEAGNTVRDFTNNEGMLIKLVTNDKHNFIGVGLVNADDDFAETTKKLRQAAKTIKHCGDYGELWYQPVHRDVWWVCGDADCDPNGSTDTVSMITKKLLLPGIKDVYVEAESFPLSSPGWLLLGKYGKVVNP